MKSCLRLVAAVPLFLGACSYGYLEERKDSPASAPDILRNADLTPKSPQPVQTSQSQPPLFTGFSLFGSGAPKPADLRTTAEASTVPVADPGLSVGGDGYTLNYENAPIASVAKEVLNDTLGLTVVIDPRAQGAITVTTGRPIPRKDLLIALEGALRANGLTMTREGQGYHIGPAGENTIGPGDHGGAAEPGYGLTLVPLQYVSAQTMVKLLEGLSARPGMIRADASSSILIVMGTGAERQATLDTVRSFDQDFMRGQSVGLYPVHNSEPETLVASLEKILDSGESGLGHGLVKLQPIARQNAVLVVSAKPELLRTAAIWIARLDAPNANASSVHVYKLRYGDAKQIAQLLAAMFSGGGGTDASTGSLAPGSGGSALSSGRSSLAPTSDATPGVGLTALGGAPSASGGAPSQNGLGANASSSNTGSSFGGLSSSALSAAFQSGGNANAAMPGAKIVPDLAGNAIVVYANATDYHTIERALDELDRPKAQVAIDVTIAEVTLNDQLNYGVQVYLNNQFGGIVNSATGQPTTAANANAGFNVFIGSGATPRAIVNALHAVTDVRILSNPSLVVLDNQEARLEVGDEVPVSTGSATVLTTSNTVVNTIEYKNTGIILHVLPRISPEGVVRLDIDQEISAVNPAASASSAASSSGELTPTISQRRVQSAVSVNSGQMVMLAGLISDQQEKTRSGVPGFSQLPLVGGAFGTTGSQTNRTELVILIRPQVIRNGVDAADVAEQLRAKMRNGKTPAFSLPNALDINARAPQ